MAGIGELPSVIVPKEKALSLFLAYMSLVSDPNCSEAWNAGLSPELSQAHLFKGKRLKGNKKVTGVRITLHSGTFEAFKQFFGLV